VTDVLILFSELVVGCDMSSIVHEKLYQRHEDETHRLLALTNDIYLLNQQIILNKNTNNQKEEEDGDDLLEKEKKITEILEKFHQWLSLWDETSNQLIQKFSGIKQLPAYLKSIKQVFAGNLTWGLYSLFSAENAIHFLNNAAC